LLWVLDHLAQRKEINEKAYVIIQRQAKLENELQKLELEQRVHMYEGIRIIDESLCTTFGDQQVSRNIQKRIYFYK